MGRKNNYFLIFTFTLLSILLIDTFASIAQDSIKSCKIKTAVAFQSRYIWRGLPLGGAYPSIQPTLELNKSKFTLGAFGAFSTSGIIPNQEVDLYASYTFLKDMFTFTVTDYFFPTDTVKYNYFNYDKKSTGHVFETSLKFNGTDKIPFTLLIATNVHGNDARKANGDITYSTYVELGYTKKVKETTLNVFIGSSLNTPGNDMPGYYATTKSGIINLGLTASKDIVITDKFSLPVSTSLIFNPDAKKIFFVFGFTL